MKRIIFCALSLLGLLPLSAQLLTDESRQRVRQGNKLYEEGEYVEAEVNYRKAQEGQAGLAMGAYNLGNALYQQGRFQDAAGQFARAASLTEDPAMQAQAYHNLGNAQLKLAERVQAKQDPSAALRQGIEAYKQALRRNPNDEETRYNLAYALQKLRREQQQNQQGQSDNNQEDQPQDQPDQDQPDQDQQDDEQEGDKQKQEQPSEEEQQQRQARQQQMSPEEIEQMLEALRYQEQKLREEMQREKTKGKRSSVEKDW